MKKSLKTLAIFLILFTSLSCEKKQDWTCICVDNFTSTVIVSEIIILDETKTEATKECDEKSLPLIDPAGITCHLERN